MNNTESTIARIKDILVERYPELNIYVKSIIDTNEYFILVDDRDIFEDDGFLQLITDINLNILLEENIANVFLASLLENENMTTGNIKQIYSSTICVNTYTNYNYVVNDLKVTTDVIYTSIEASDMGDNIWTPQQELAIAA